MATLDHSAPNAINRIPINRRIAEVMAERGNAFSIRNLSEKIGINRETLRQIVTGGRRVSPSELEKILHGLGVSIERIKQMDTYSKEQELANFFSATKRTKPMVLRASAIANDLVNVAIGATERAQSLNQLGRIQFIQAQYDDSHRTWLQALEYAKIVQEQYDDRQHLDLITANLMLTYTIRREYSNIENVLQIVEETFQDNPRSLGMVFFTRMNVAKDRGNLEEATEHSYRSLEYFEKTDDSKQIGIALINVAHFEYEIGNYTSSGNALISAIKHLEQYDNYLVICVKEYAKCLIQLGEFDEAIKIIDQYDSVAKDYPEYWGKLQLLYSVLKNDPSFAERISNSTQMSVELRYDACMCLFDFYLEKDDATTAIKYYKKARIFSNSKSKFYDREGF